MISFSATKLAAYSQALILPLLCLFNFTKGQSTTFTTSTTTETWIVKDVTFSTVVTRLPWCPLPTAGAPVSASGPIVVQLSFRANVTDGSDSGDGVVTFVMDRNGEEIVVSNNPLILSLNTDLALQEYSDTPQILYFSLPSDLTPGRLEKRFDDLLPVLISDQVPSSATFEGWFEDTDGEFFIKVQTSEGELILGFTICPTDGTAASGQKVYVYDLSLGVPDTSACVRAAANTLPYPLWTAGATSLPTGVTVDPFNPESGATTPTTTRSRTSRRTSSSRVSSSSSSGGSSRTNTITSMATSTPTITSSGMRSSSTSGSSVSSTIDSSSSSTNSSSSSSSDTRVYTTTTFWTTGVPDGTTSATSTVDAADATVTVSEYRPYPSSIKIVSTRDGATSSAIYYIKALFRRDWIPALPSSYEDPTAAGFPFVDNLVWVLNDEGHLYSPIYGPYISNAERTWQGLGRNYTRLYIVGSKTTSTDVPQFSGIIIRPKMAEEILDTDVLLSFNIASSGALSLNSAVNTTAGYGIWACEETGNYWGITDGSDPWCQWDLITAMHMQGNPVVVDSPVDYYGFVTTDAAFTEGLGDGKTVTKHKLVPKSVVTTTTELTAGDAYLVTVGTNYQAPGATVTFGQRVERQFSSNYWDITVSVSSTVIGPAAPTKTIIQYLAPSGAPMYRIYRAVDGDTSASSRKYFSFSSTTTGSGTALMLTGDANTDPTTQRQGYFWNTPGVGDLIARGYNLTHRYTEPSYSYFDSATNRIEFYTAADTPPSTAQKMTWAVVLASMSIIPSQPSNPTTWGDGDLSIWMCGKDAGTGKFPSGPNTVYLATSGSTASGLGLTSDCESIEDSLTNLHYEDGVWADGTYWKRDNDGAWRDDNGVTYDDFVAKKK
ncbi:hypothetical protein TWF730_002706 [Orbilia blumenaviensis]|uniref:Uncharacterized protein n=1 Tax=Orbilia blumenaviensis TaxID=1796055 RepID=A0AAV9UBE4_9PEZI